MENDFLNSNKEMIRLLGLTSTPFPVTPDPTHYFILPQVEEKIYELMHFIHLRKGFLLFTADAGIGKSTLSRYLMMNLDINKTRLSLVVNTFLQGVELLKAINHDFGIDIDGALSEQLRALNQFLLSEYRKGKNCLIIIDDAQNLSIESLEMIRQISNFEANSEKVVQILLIAQPEIIKTLQKQEIRQLKSRIALHVEMQPFTLDETRQYVNFKLDSAGNQHHIRLNHKALKALYKYTKGYPRHINAIMDRVLYVLYVKEQFHIDNHVIKVAVDDLNRAEGALTPYSHSHRNYIAAGYGVLISAAALIAYFGIMPSPTPLVIQTQPEKVEELNSKLALNESKVNFSDLPPVLDDPLITSTEKPQDSNKLKEVKVLQEDNGESATLLKEQKAVVETLKDVKHLDPDINEPLTQFLKQYDLLNYYQQANEAFQLQDIDAFKKVFNRIERSIVVTQIAVPESYPDLLFLNNDGSQYRVFFWQPNIVLTDFYFGLKSDEVKKLQLLLKKHGFLMTRIDSTIGSKTIYAIVQFQREVGLKATGQLDNETHFYLENY